MYICTEYSICIYMYIICTEKAPIMFSTCDILESDK